MTQLACARRQSRIRRERQRPRAHLQRQLGDAVGRRAGRDDRHHFDNGIAGVRAGREATINGNKATLS
jgi:hypothetical protein